MLIIPQCMYCKYATIKEEKILCSKHESVPEQIENGKAKCKYHKKPIKNKF